MPEMITSGHFENRPVWIGLTFGFLVGLLIAFSRRRTWKAPRWEDAPHPPPMREPEAENALDLWAHGRKLANQ